MVQAAGSGTSSSSNSGVVNLTAFDVAMSDPNDYGNITVYLPSRSAAPIDGPLLAEERMVNYKPASSAISLLNTNGSSVILGNVLMVPIGGSMLYVLPVYVTSTVANVPRLEEFITRYNQSTAFEPNLDQALTRVLGSGRSTTSPGTKGQTIRQLLADAQANYANAETALSHKNLGAYQHDVGLENADINKVLSLLTGGSTTKKTGTGATTKA